MPPDGDRPVADAFAGARTFRVALSRAGRVERIAERLPLAWGFRAADAVGLDFADLPWWRDVPETRARIAASVARARAGEPVHGTVRIVTARNESRELALTFDPIGEHEAVDFVLVAGMDVTALRREDRESGDEADERLRHRARDLTVRDERKNAFLATLAHELRNPLAPLAHALQLLEDGRDRADTSDGADRAEEAAERAALHRMMERQVTQLTHLVDDLLDVSRISSGKLVLRESVIELDTLVSDALETCRPLIEGRGHALETRLPAGPVRLRGDPVRLVQVLANLLTNAARYTDEGGRIEVRASADGAGVRIAVRDDGAGLDEASRERIFEMFTQVPGEGAPRNAFGGLGLGLTLARRLVELHGGEILVDSEGLGRGSTFTLALPAARLVLASASASTSTSTPGASASGPVARENVADVTGLAVAVVDDNRDAADALATLLRRRGCTVEVGYDGAAALALVRAGAPDVLILDIGLPDVSGHEVAERLRAEGTGTMLIALTGLGTEQDVERGREAGFEHHLVKPVRAASVLALLERFAAAAVRGSGR